VAQHSRGSASGRMARSRSFSIVASSPGLSELLRWGTRLFVMADS
jgi:hypothetical protein